MTNQEWVKQDTVIVETDNGASLEFQPMISSTGKQMWFCKQKPQVVGPDGSLYVMLATISMLPANEHRKAA